MKHYISLTLILFVTCCRAQPAPIVVYDSTYQIRIHPTLPAYFIHFRVVDGKNADGETACLFSIATHSSIDQHLIDSVYYSKKDFEADDLRYIYSSKSYNETKPQFYDVNFDGYLDLRMVSFKYNYYDFSYDYYLYNPEEKKFQFSEEFTSVCNNATIDSKQKTIQLTSTTVRDCGYCWEEKTYRVENNLPVLSQLVISELETINGVSKWKLTTKRNIKGTMKIVHTEYNDLRP